MAIKTIVVDNQGITSLIAELPLNSYTYKIVNKSKAIGIQKTVKQVVGKPLSNGNTDANSDGITDGYNDIPAEIQSPYISDETITFYTMEGDFNANNLDDEHKITATPAGSANIYITYTTTNLGSKFVKLSGSSPFNLKNSSGQYLYDNGSAVVAETNSDTNNASYVTNTVQLWYFYGNDPYDMQIRNANSNKYLTTSSSAPARSDDTVSFMLISQSDGADASHKTITLKNLANSETITLGVNTVVLPISYTLIDRKGVVIEAGISYDDTEGFELPDAWKSPVVDYHYWNADAFVGTDGTPTVPFVFKNDPVPTEITSATQVTSNNIIYVTYTLKSDNTIDLDGRNSLNVTNKVNKTYRLRFLEGVSFNQEKSDAVMPDPKTKAIYPYSNGDAALYVYGQKQWDDQLASGASTRTRWLWIIEPANNPSSAADLDPYHIKISSYQTQTSYKIDDNNTRNFHSYLRTYKPDDYSAIVTGVTNDNPLAHGGGKADPAVTNLQPGSEYMLLGTSLSSLKLVTVDKISDGSTTERRTINSFEQYWKNNPTVQGKLTTKVTAEGREITLSTAQKTEIAAIEGTESLKWHSYNTWANSQPWVNNGDAAPGKAATTSKKFLNEEHVFQTISMGSGAFTLEETEIKPMLILLDQHGWEIVRLPLPSGPSDPNRAARYADIHKYSSPMVARYHFWKTGSKVPGYHKYKVSDYATVSATDDTEYTADELGRADLNNSTPNLPNYETQAKVDGKERDWYVTYDVKPEYASTYAGAATKDATSAAPFLVKQGGVYAKVGDNNTLTTDSEPASIEDVPTTMQWYLRPNFDIDEEMGYIYAGNPGAEEEAKSKEDTELDYFDHTREDAVSTWSNGFDPYNVQIQSVSNTARYFTANTEHSAVTSSWTGTSSSLSLQNLGTKQSNIEGLDNVKMNITNATFMVVDDGNGNMRLMPRFDNTKVMQSFTTLATQAAAAPANDNGTANQSLFLTLVPKVVTSSSQINAMGGYYMLASNFTASGSIGTKDAPFKGIIEGQIDHSFSVSAPFIAYAEDAIIRNVIIESSSVSSGNDDGHAGAIVATALGDTRIYNCGVNGGSVSGTNHVGGIVGHLDGNARVINCYSYATIAGGSDVGGIVGYNNVATTAAMIDEGNGTMVMNCMFYGDITGGTTVSPVYGGNNINNLNSGGLNTFNYYAYDVLTKEITTGKYNCALGVEDVFLKRFETYRQLLNSNRRLAAYYATSSKETVHAEDMMKWVLETADRSIAEPKPYPVLKAQGKYPSIINYDTRDLANYSEENRNQGLKIGTLSVTISGVGSNAPDGATVNTTPFDLVRTDKDYDHFNYNYDKVQLPYYNDYGTKNYTGGKVVTGWKITGFTGGTAGTYNAADTWGGYNFADRNCTNKDLYGTGGSNRVFAQGAYFDVPYGVTGITIEPYWGNAAYVADEYLDVVYNTTYGEQKVTQLGKWFDTQKITIDGSEYTVYKTIDDAAASLTSGSNVYDNAIVLVGNVHLAGNPPTASKFTIMSADFDKDNEPDYSFIFGHNDRQAISPVRFDFINMPGIAMAQKPNGAGTFRNVSIFKPKGWFETTNTCITRFVQFEYDNGGKSAAPVIIQGGMVDQFVSTKTSEPKVTQYIHLGGNVWFRDFGNGTHSDGNKFTPHIPISVTGGDFDGLYLSGTYRPDAAVKSDNAECYVSGGHFGEMAGAAQQQINGDVQWQIYNADIDNFYGGGINFDKPVTGHITTDIINSHVGTFCGGPKFGDMSATKNVTTRATGCTFDTYFGAGYGGISYNRIRTRDKSGTDVDFSSWKGDYTGKRGKYYTDNKGIATDFDYEFFVWSTGVVGARFYVKYSSLSMAKTNDVSSTLTNCIINKNFYGGGNLGKVDGKATSVLNSCTVEGNVFGGGYSASTPKVPIRTSDVFASTPGINADAGVFDMGEKSATEDYTLVQGTLTNNSLAINKDTKTITTNVDMTVLGQVTTTDLTISGNTIVKGQIFDEEGDVLETTGGVFGGGDMSAVNGNTDVKVEGTESTEGVLNVFGGGNKAIVKGTTTVEIDGTSSIKHNVYGGGNEADVLKTTTVNMNAGTVMGSIYGGGNLGDVGRIDDKSNKRQYIWTGLDGNANSTEPYAANNSGVTHVNITGGTVGPAGDAVSTEENPGNVFGGGKGAATSFWCENGMVYSTNVSISDGTVKGSVYGGGELGRVETDTKVTIGPETGDHNTEIKGNVFGAGKGVQTHGYSALVRGNTEVIVQNGSKVNQNVYGGGEIASVGKYSVDSNGMPYSLANNGSGICHVTIPGATQITGDIFGGGKGFVPSDTFLDNETYTGDDLPKRMTIDGEGNSIWQNYNNRTDYLIYLQTLALATETEVIINPGTSATPIQSTKGNVYGGSENGIVQHSTSVTISGDCKIGDEGIATSGNIYGGGKGHEKMEGAGLVGENAVVTINSGNVLASVYGGGVLGATKGNVTVNINGGTVNHDVYGGGAYAHTNTSNWHLYSVVENPTNPQSEGLYERSFGGAYTLTTDTEPVTSPEAKTYYRKNESATWIDPTQKSALNTTRLNLRGGTIVGDAYGGALGDATHSPKVYGDILVDLNKETCTDSTNVTTKTASEKGCVVNQVFGCNNAYGSPQGNVTVHVYGTQNKDASKGTISEKFVKDDINLSSVSDVSTLKAYLADQIKVAKAISVTTTTYEETYNNGSATEEAVKTAITGITSAIATALGTGTDEEKETKQATANALRYDVRAVYGGGNKAAYEPAYPDEATTSKSQVIIEGCELTSINHVYGGGNAAPVPSTDVTIKGTYLINAVYGGGNGSGAGNPGADVGKKTNGSTYGTGIAKTKLLGGYINSVYGGSNTKGDVVGGTDVSTKGKNETITITNGDYCSELKLGTVYGAGSHADVSGNVNIILECMPEDFVDAVYGGAEMATVNGNVSLTVTSGKFGRVFGGNNAGGNIRGAITVNVYEDGCKPLIIGELYGGGNAAPYSIYGCTEDNGTWTANESGTTYYGTDVPDSRTNVEVYVYSCTSIGKVFGGGMGETAKVIGNTRVYINPMKGIVNGVTQANIGKIGQVFGGGALANVKGNTLLDIGTALASEPNGVRIESGDDYLSPTSNTTTSITAGIYGGGSEADVDGDATLNIGTANLPLGVNIVGDIFGGGYGETTHVTGNVVVNIGTDESGTPVGYANITGDVYGGSAKGKVNSHLVSEVETATGGVTEVNLYGGTISGNLYGGGLGVAEHAADVYGLVKVKVIGGQVVNVFGCNNVNGMPKSTVDVEIGTKTGKEPSITYSGTGVVTGSVYGGGNMAACTGSPTVKLYKGTVNTNVYGGGLGSTAVTGGATVNMEGGLVKNDVFGGGSLADVTGNVSVVIAGGTVTNDVYGGGALANTNTGNWNSSTNTWNDATTGTYYAEMKHLTVGASVTGYYTRSGEGPYSYEEATGTATKDTKYYKKLTGFLNVAANGTTYKTTVSLTGGTIGNAYGGGLGRFAVAAVGSPGDPGYVAAVEAVEAMVYGDVTVTVDGTKFTKETERVDGKAIPTTGRVFGCNNKNGTPKGSVLVWVKQTKRLDGADGHVKNQFEIQGVYGGGNMANYVPNTDSYDVQTEFGRKTQVLIQDCGTTSIERVYGGGNASNVPFTDVTIDGCFQIGYVFGGGNGGDKINKETGAGWENNPGANVTNFTNVLLKGGTIGDAFGGSDSNGSVGGTNLVKSSGSCPLVINNVYGASKEADSDGDVILDLSGCGSGEVDKVFGGSYNANVRGSVTINITSGIYTSVYGGNDRKGSIGGNVTINIEEVDQCNPIIIQNLFGGGSQADYPGTGAKYVTNAKDPSTGRYTGEGVTYNETTGTYTGLTYADFTSGTLTLNIKAATRIDRVFGGCDNAKATGNTVVNINMVKGSKAGGRFTLPTTYTGETIPTVHAEEAYVEVTGLTENESPVTGYYERSGESGSYVYTLTEDTKAQSGKTYCEHFTHKVDNAIGTIGHVYGGGNEGDVDGNTTVNIGSLKDIAFEKTPAHLTKNANEKYDVLGADIRGDVFGGGNLGEVSGNTTVNIQTADYSTPLTGFVGVNIKNGSIYGGGSSADVKGNTNVTMSGGYVCDGVYGGGLHGSVGSASDDDNAIIYHTGTKAHSNCIGKIEKYKTNTGKCTVVISGGQIGPVEAALADGGMKNPGHHLMDVGASAEHNPVDVGFVFGAGRGEVENPDTDPDADFRTYVKETDVTISGGIVMASVYGGGENGRVRGNTLVKIQGGQIGCGEGKVTGTGTAADPHKPIIHTEADWTTADPANFSDCASWDYGKVVGGKTVYLPYDPLADVPYRDGTTVTNGSTEGSDGHTYYGYVFGGGSGYFPYEIKDADGNVIAHDWLASAGVVEGNTKVEITGGHILTCVYGGNELTSVTGDSCVVIMTGGTLGVPRSNEDILKKPMTCYLFGGGKGDQREHFKMYTNVQNTRVEVKGTARIFGSVFGGAEDGHVSGNAKVNILGTARIGMSGTSYVDGNIFGGGRGFSGTELTAGTVKGNTEINVSETPTLLGSIYGGGRLASVGVDFAGAQNATTGQFIEDGGDNTYGHVTINISGGTIGKEGVTGDGAKYSGNVFGGAMGRLTLLDGSPNALWSRMAQVKTSSVNITGGTIKRNVYGGAEFGTTRDNVYVTIGGSRNESTGAISDSGTPVVNGSIYGGGHGSDEHRTEYNSTITAGVAPNQITYLFTPLQYAGCIGGDTYVNVVGSGHVNGSVYGGGELASVGVIDYRVDSNDNYTQVIKHASHSNDGKEVFYDFGLSWPYEFKYVEGITGGTTHVNITGSAAIDNYVYGGGKGQVSFGDDVVGEGNSAVYYDEIDKQRYTEAHIANVRETEVTIGTSGGSDNPQVRTVYGGGEDGHVNGDAKVTIHRGTIERTVFGGGKGTSTFKTYLLNTTSEGNLKSTPDDVYSWTAGKVYGNTEVKMNGGKVGWFIYGGGNMGSVGKGNYTGGKDDYSTGGYGELPSADGAIWTATPASGTYAHYFQNSGKTTVTIMGGTLGDEEAGLQYDIPKGSVFGGSRGQTAANCELAPRYRYVPDFYVGYVNNATINIGGTSTSDLSDNTPNIYGCIYGGGQDGHVRNSTEVKIFKGNINKQTGAAADRSGNVFGAGSGIGTYRVADTDYCNSSSGSVTCSTLVEVSGESTTIDGNVYGGGALASVGPPLIGTKYEQKAASDDHKSYSHNLVNIKGGSIGGSVYGASRGPGSVMFPSPFTAIGTSATQYDPTAYATSIWTEVNVSGGTIGNNVYGGGEMGQVKESTVVNLTGGSIAHDAYGGGKGTRGTNAIEANVGGNTTVKLNEGKTSSSNGCIVEKIFGCNDQNGTPKGHALVHVYATQHKGTTKIVPDGGKYAKFKSMEGGYTISNYSDNTNADDLKKLATTVGLTADEISDYESAISGGADDNAKKAALENYIEVIADKKYDVLAVYGGGDLAMYKPTDNSENTEVIIEGCDLTSIKQVYGGGNAASTPANSVRINAAYEIHEVFGGGNGKDDYEVDGKWYKNLGANVGYYATYHSDTSDNEKGTQGNPYPAVANDDADTPEERRANTSYHYGKGTANLIITGGRIHTTYGGSNTRGNVRAEVHTSTEDAGVCDLLIDKSYPAGKNADTDAGSKVEAKCVDYQAAIYGGAKDANVYSDVVIDVTNGTYGAIYGGNDTSGKIYGSITINVHEEGCKPIVIGELYGGGKEADYSIYGYNDDGSARTKAQYEALTAEQKALITVQRDPQINIISATKIGKIYGGGYQAKVIGSPSVNVNMEKGFISSKYASDAKFDPGLHPVPNDHGMEASYYVEKREDDKAILQIGTIGTIYGGGFKGDIQGNTSVEIGTGEWLNATGERETITPARKEATITGNVFGGGEGQAPETGDDAFTCEKAMVGVVDSGEGSTSVIIGNALVKGDVYGGGKIGRVESNTSVTIGIENNTTDTITVKGSVYGAGQGVETHGYSGLTRGNSTVIVQGKAKVLGSVYGGGEMATVGRYWVNTTPATPGAPVVPAGTPTGFPYALRSGGLCTVTIRDDAEIGPDDMIMTKVGGPDNTGHVFGAGKGVMPTVYTYTDNANKPWHIDGSGNKVYSANETAYLGFVETLGLVSSTNVTIDENAFVKGDVFGGAEQGFVQHDTHVTIDGNSQIGNGYAQMADDGTYLGTKVSVNRRYTDTEWSEGRLYPTGDLATSVGDNYQHSLPECASWPYAAPYAPYDKYAEYENEGKYYYDSSHTKYAEGGRTTGSDGHTFFGNVFGGGSGFFPYKAGKWHWKAGNVGGNTLVEIKGGHVLTNVYGANEMTNVEGKATVRMTGGTIGVPRTLGQIINHPVTCYLFGGGGGDMRVLFNKQTNVQDAEVSVTGGWVYGSVFGGSEDGHVMRNVDLTIGGTAKIGTWGTSYVDGNIFGGGRGFSADAYTAGNVAGCVNMTISGGTILGSVYGGGRLGSVGYGLYDAGADGYGEIREDHKMDNGDADGGFFDKGRGHVDITISGGTIGNDYEYKYIEPETTIDDSYRSTNHIPYTEFGDDKHLTHTKGGNVFAGGMGRMTQLDGTTAINDVDWWRLGNVKSTKVTITGGTIKSNVYGGGELGMVQGTHTSADSKDVSTEIIISGGTIGTEITKKVDDADVTQYTFGSVFGGGYGSLVEKLDHTGSTNPTYTTASYYYTYPKYIAGRVKGGTEVTMTGGAVKASVYGGGEMAAVGESYLLKNDPDQTILGETLTGAEGKARDGHTYVTISGGTIGIPNVDNKQFGGGTMGNVYGGGSGYINTVRSGQIYGNTNVNISGTPTIYHNVYGGGAYGTVGDFTYGMTSETVNGVETKKVSNITGLHAQRSNTGTANVTITGGTIGVDGHENGMVFGSSRGEVDVPGKRPDWLAWVNTANVTIGTAGHGYDAPEPQIMGSVYGSGENGHTCGNTTLNIHSGVIGDKNATKETFYKLHGNVYGGGCGEDKYWVDANSNGVKDSGEEHYNPTAGIVRGNTEINIDGGLISGSVYGAGAVASVGYVTSKTEHPATIVEGKEVIYNFGLSWPYEFVFENNTGKATINITGGHIGIDGTDGGDVYGSARGEAGDRYTMAQYAYVKDAEVNVNFSSTASPSDLGTLATPCITGSVHGSGENGYVYGDTKVTLNKGLIGHSLYGAGKGIGTYTVSLPVLTNKETSKDRKIYGLLSGKVLGNTLVTMNGGQVVRNVYGGGNMASVGKGNYAGGTDDYSTGGYGELPPSDNLALWSNEDFLNSGGANVRVFGGTVGDQSVTANLRKVKNGLPYGNVLGGSAGEAAPNIYESPRYHYCPAFFSGYVNETKVTIGGGYKCIQACNDKDSKAHAVGETMSIQDLQMLFAGTSSLNGDGTPNASYWKAIDAPTILSSVYGGGQDGHVRRDTYVIVNGGTIGLAYNAANQSLMGTDNLDNPLWLFRGNVFGGGSGVNTYKFDFDGDDEFTSTVSYGRDAEHLAPTKEEDYSTSAGSVTRFTDVKVLGGTIHRNVYGGGSIGSVGAPKTGGQTYDPYKPGQPDIPDKPVNVPGRQSLNKVTIGGAGAVTIGTPEEYQVHYGGEVYGACRGDATLNANQFGTSVWTQVFIKNGATIQGNVFGGGDSGKVKKDTDVQIGAE